MMCLQKGTPVDDFPLPGGWASDVDKEHFGPENQLTHLMCKVPTLKHRLKAILGLYPDPVLRESIMGLVLEAEAIDTEVAALHSQMLPVCGHRTVGICNSVTEDWANAFFWPGPIEVYNDLFAATFINFCRISRISCQHIIASCYTWLGQNMGDALALERSLKSVSRTQRITDEICASVPFHLRPDFLTNGALSGEFLTGECLVSFCRSVCCNTQLLEELYHAHDVTLAAKMSPPGTVFILWPLLLCVNKPYLPVNQNKWILGRLRLICDIWNMEEDAETGVTLENFLSNLFQPRAYELGAVYG